MSRRGARLWLAAIVAAAALARAAALRWAPPHHPDQFFQYLEPAWGRLTGAGIETWEWIDGVRSWVLPGYHGAWMAVLRRLGLSGPTIGLLLQAHWAVLSLFLVGAGWRGGALVARRWGARHGAGPRPEPAGATRAPAPPAGWQGGLLGALLCALFPLLVMFSVQTLSELASSLCFVWGLVLTGEMVEAPPPAAPWRAAVAGFCLSLAACLRIQHGPLILVPIGWLLVARRRSVLPPLLAGALVPLAIFGLVDRLTWGRLFGSFIAYIDFNVAKRGASQFGTSPWAYYWQGFRHRLPFSLPILALAVLAGLRAGWPFIASALSLVGVLQTQPHKEERFVFLFWPLVLIAAAGVAGGWLAGHAAASARTPPETITRRARRRLAAVVVGLASVLADGARHAGGTEFNLTRARLHAQAWVGRQDGATGLLYDEPLYTGGYLWLGRTFPQLRFSVELLENPLFTHVLVARGSEAAGQATRAGFMPVFDEDDFVVLARPRALPR